MVRAGRSEEDKEDTDQAEQAGLRVRRRRYSSCECVKRLHSHVHLYHTLTQFDIAVTFSDQPIFSRKVKNHKTN